MWLALLLFSCAFFMLSKFFSLSPPFLIQLIRRFSFLSFLI